MLVYSVTRSWALLWFLSRFSSYCVELFFWHSFHSNTPGSNCPFSSNIFLFLRLSDKHTGAGNYPVTRLNKWAPAANHLGAFSPPGIQFPQSPWACSFMTGKTVEETAGRSRDENRFKEHRTWAMWGWSPLRPGVLQWRIVKDLLRYSSTWWKIWRDGLKPPGLKTQTRLKLNSVKIDS